MSKKQFDIKDYIKSNKFKLESEPKTGKHVSKGYNDIRKTILNEVKINEKGQFDLNESLRGDKKEMSEDTKRHFLEIISTYNSYQENLKRKSDLIEISKTLGAIVEAAKHMTLQEADDWFDKVTVKRNMKQLEKLDSEFDKIASEAKSLDNRMIALYEDMGHILNRYYEISDITEDEMNERLGEKKRKLKEASGEITKIGLQRLSTFFDEVWYDNKKEVKEAVSWYANSVYGSSLPNNLHPKKVTRKMLTKVFEDVYDDVQDDNGEYGYMRVASFLKKIGTPDAKRFIKRIK